MIILNHAGSLSYTISTVRTTTYCHCEKKVMGNEILQRQRVARQRTKRGICEAEREAGGHVGSCCVRVGSGVQTDDHRGQTSKSLLLFLLLGFHLPVREKWAKMYKSVSQHSYLSIFLKILSFFR